MDRTLLCGILKQMRSEQTLLLETKTISYFTFKETNRPIYLKSKKPRIKKKTQKLSHLNFQKQDI